jgi:O-methyltransferase involved in polyketide biosynthesis
VACPAGSLFLGDNPDGTIVALGEGLETQFWRVDNGRMRWLTVDLVETIEVRRKLLPDGPRNTTLAGSATDAEWTRQVDATKGLLITAQGLLTYFQPDEVTEFIAMCADRLPGSRLLFDSVPKWMMSQRDHWIDKSSDTYRPPPWVWGMDKAERARLAALPGVISLRDLRQPRGRGVVFGAILPALQRVPTLRYRMPTFPIMVARLG